MSIDELPLLQTVIEESPVAMALYLGPEMIVRLVNKAMLAIWKADQTVIGKTFQAAIPKLYTPQLQRQLNEIYNSGNTYEVTERRLDLIFNNQLDACYYNIIFKPLKDANQAVWGILVTAIDVTAQVLAQQQAKIKERELENDQQFRNLIDHAPIAIGIFKGWDMIIDSANDSLLELWGKDDKLTGLPLLEALPEIKGSAYMDLLRNVYTTGKSHYGYEMPSRLYQKRYGKDSYFNYIYKPIVEEDGKINSILVIANDVTVQVLAKKELEESENRFKNLILEAPMATALYVGREMMIEVANEAMLKLWGKDASVIGTHLSKALPELEGQPFFRLLEAVFTTGIPYHTREGKADLVVDGRLQSFYFNFTYKPLVDSEGRVYAILNMAVDVTTEVQARAELQEISNKKDEFLSVTSHELKTPLTSLKASMQLNNKIFKNTPNSSAIPVFIHKANSSLTKILHLIDDLMHLSKVQQGHLPLNKTRFNLTAVLSECCEHVADNSYKLIIEGEKHLEVNADYARIDQVVINFINNAIKYAPNSKVIILRVEKLGNEARVSVQDFGIGITPENQERLFDRYYRVDYSGIQFSGLGLGLYIAAEIIERHNGKIGVDSVKGEGSTFWFTLPL